MERLEFVFKNGLSTLKMQSARHLPMSTLSTWIECIKDAVSDVNVLSNTDAALISAAFSRIEYALEFDHNIQIPYYLKFGKPEHRINWLADSLKAQLQM
ncbi:hypothetical protein FG062_14525 [Vibrio cholerae]|nr:hypothetical protein [Vibrio cholerae]EGR0600829.1 hypothetical protein [Vibrio cholerae]